MRTTSGAPYSGHRLPWGLCVMMMLLFSVSCIEEEERKYDGSGVFEAVEITVGSLVPGRLASSPVQEGSIVKKDDLIAQIDTESLELEKQRADAGIETLKVKIEGARVQIDQARINRDALKKNYERIKTLFEKNSTTVQQFDEIEAKYNVAEKQLLAARTNLSGLQAGLEEAQIGLKIIEHKISEAEIKAPCDGIVINSYAEKGELVGQGTPIATIADMSEMEIKIYVEADMLDKIKVGTKADIFIDPRPDDPIEGEVIWISPEAEFTPKNVQTREARAVLVYAVKIRAENPERAIKIGMPADVVLE